MFVNLRENQVLLGEEEKIKAKGGESRSSDPIPYSGNLRSKCFRAVSEQKNERGTRVQDPPKKGMNTIKTTKLYLHDHD